MAAPDVLTEVPESALGIYAHPDDADVACAGTLASWAAAGCRVGVVICTDGGKGTTDPSVEPAELVRDRARELEASASVVGLAEHHVLGMGDGELESGPELLELLVAQIRQFRPEVVLGHDPTAVFFGQEYFNHHDHRAAGWALLDAVAPAAALPHYFPEAGDPHQVATVLLSGTLEPDVWVDITATLERKVAAVECHQSQFPSGIAWVGDAVRRRATEEGRRAGTDHAEGFRRLRLAR